MGMKLSSKRWPNRHLGLDWADATDFRNPVASDHAESDHDGSSSRRPPLALAAFDRSTGDVACRSVGPGPYQGAQTSFHDDEYGGADDAESARRWRPDGVHRRHGHARQPNLLPRGADADDRDDRCAWHAAVWRPLPARRLFQNASSTAPS